VPDGINTVIFGIWKRHNVPPWLLFPLPPTLSPPRANTPKCLVNRNPDIVVEMTLHVSRNKI
jgi:hypothetical protein